MRVIQQAHHFEHRTDSSESDEDMPANSKMKLVRRVSVVEEFEVTSSLPVPSVPEGGARIKVHFAGACYTKKQLANSGVLRPKMAGIRDNTLFEGYEISGVVDAVCSTLTDNKFRIGDAVILYPEEQDSTMEDGYAEYIIVKNINNLIKLPINLSLEVGAMLPTGGLTAMNTIIRTRPLLYQKATQKNAPINILIVGAGGLGFWTLVLAKHFCMAGNDNVCLKSNIIVADTDMKKLEMAKELGCSNIVHWDESVYEDHLLERTRCICEGGIDMIIDYCSSKRTIDRCMKLLDKDAILVVGGNSRHEVSFCLHTLATQQQTIMGVGQGTREQLSQLVELVASGKIEAPSYQIFPVDNANEVFEQINKRRLSCRAILQLSPSVEDTEED